MYKDFWYPSCGKGKIHGCRWEPEGQPKAVVQIIHGIAEFAARYDEFAQFLNTQGYLVVAEDHMGHGESVKGGSTQGYFHGGWDAAVEDSYALMKKTMAEFPGVPYILFGHSMGSFMARTILCKHPDSGIAAAVICGTAWMPTKAMPAMIRLCGLIARMDGEEKPSHKLQKIMFGGYNRRVEHQRTEFDWLTRDPHKVDAYVADPMCGFVASGGLVREMVKGIYGIQRPDSLQAMDRKLPVLFVAGGEDPVGGYGTGVQQAAEKFREVGMEKVSCRLYPLCRHEILNEINRKEIFEDIFGWMKKAVEE